MIPIRRILRIAFGAPPTHHAGGHWRTRRRRRRRRALAGTAGAIDGLNLTRAKCPRVQRNLVNEPIEWKRVEGPANIANPDGRVACRDQVRKRPKSGVGLAAQNPVNVHTHLAGRSVQGGGNMLPLVVLNRSLNADERAVTSRDTKTNFVRRATVNEVWIQASSIVASEENVVANGLRINPRFDSQ